LLDKIPITTPDWNAAIRHCCCMEMVQALLYNNALRWGIIGHVDARKLHLVPSPLHLKGEDATARLHLHRVSAIKIISNWVDIILLDYLQLA
jgi:hypothetical protein